MYDTFVSYWGKGGSQKKGGTSSNKNKHSSSNEELDSDEEAELAKAQPKSLVATEGGEEKNDNEGDSGRGDPFHVINLALRNPSRAHVLLRATVGRAPLSEIQTFVRAAFVLLDASPATHGCDVDAATLPGAIPKATTSLLPFQVSRMQSLQRLVCAVEVARMTVLAPISNVVRFLLVLLFLFCFFVLVHVNVRCWCCC